MSTAYAMVEHFNLLSHDLAKVLDLQDKSTLKRYENEKNAVKPLQDVVPNLLYVEASPVAKTCYYEPTRCRRN